MAVLASGLRGDSRIKQKITGERLDTKEQLLALMTDCLRALATGWGKKVDSSVYDQLMGIEKSSDPQVIKGKVFSSVEEFNKERYGG